MIYEVKGGFIKRWLRSIFFECIQEVDRKKLAMTILSNRDPTIHDVLPRSGAQWTNVQNNTTHVLTKIEARWEELGGTK